MGKGKNGKREGDTQGVSRLSPSRAPFFLALITSKRLLRRLHFLSCWNLEVLHIVFQYPNKRQVSFLKADNIYHVFVSSWYHLQFLLLPLHRETPAFKGFTGRSKMDNHISLPFTTTPLKTCNKLTALNNRKQYYSNCFKFPLSLFKFPDFLKRHRKKKLYSQINLLSWEFQSCFLQFRSTFCKFY